MSPLLTAPEYCQALCGRYVGFATICPTCFATLPEDLRARLFEAATDPSHDYPTGAPGAERTDELEEWFSIALRYLTGRTP